MEIERARVENTAHARATSNVLDSLNTSLRARIRGPFGQESVHSGFMPVGVFVDIVDSGFKNPPA